MSVIGFKIDRNQPTEADWEAQLERQRLQVIASELAYAKRKIPNLKFGKRSSCRCRDSILNLSIGDDLYCMDCGRIVSKKKVPHYVRPWSCAIDGHGSGIWISRKCYCEKCKALIDRRHPIMSKTPAGKLKAYPVTTP